MRSKSLLIFSMLFIVGFCETSVDGDYDELASEYEKKTKFQRDKALSMFNIVCKSAFTVAGLKDYYELGEGAVDALLKEPELTLEEAVGKINKKLSKIEDIASDTNNALKRKEMKSNLIKFSSAVRFIHNKFAKMLFIRGIKNYNKRLKKKFVNDMLNENGNGLSETLDQIQLIIFGVNDDFESIFDVLSNNFKLFFPCHKQSPQQYFYDLMISIMAADAKGLAVYLYAMQEIMGNTTNLNSSTEEIQLPRNISKERAEKTFVRFESILTDLSPAMQRCDLQEKHKKDKTYIRLENVFERILYTYRHGLHNEDCDIEDQFDQSDANFSHYLKGQRGCNNVLSCTTTPILNICLEENQTHGPRYEYVKEHALLDCKSGSLISNEADFSLTSYRGVIMQVKKRRKRCECVCDESTNYSDRFFSLKDVTSNATGNYVVTGVRFRKINNTIYLQIKEGKLLSYGMIDESKWVPVSDSTVKKGFRDSNLYFELQWPHARGIAMKTTRAPKNYVVTGVRFGVKYEKRGDAIQHYLNLEVRVTKFNAETGQLILSKTHWEGSAFNPPIGEPFKDHNYNAPTKVHEEHVRSSAGEKLVLFEPTGSTTSDAGASTVPYLDVQPLGSSTKELPLGAVGIHHLEAPKSGGYIALHAETLDVIPFFSGLQPTEDASRLYDVGS